MVQAQELFQEAADAGHWGAAYAYALLKLEENESHTAFVFFERKQLKQLPLSNLFDAVVD